MKLFLILLLFSFGVQAGINVGTFVPNFLSTQDGPDGRTKFALNPFVSLNYGLKLVLVSEI